MEIKNTWNALSQEDAVIMSLVGYLDKAKKASKKLGSSSSGSSSNGNNTEKRNPMEINQGLKIIKFLTGRRKHPKRMNRKRKWWKIASSTGVLNAEMVKVCGLCTKYITITSSC